VNVLIPLTPLVLADHNLLCSAEHYYVEHATPSTSSPRPHTHDCYEVYINISGDVSFLVNDKLYAVQSGDLILSRPGEMHVRVIQSPCSYETYCFWFYHTQSTPLSAFADDIHMHHHVRFPEAVREHLKDIMRHIYQAERENNEIERTAWAYHLFAVLNGTTEPEQVSVPAPLPEKLQQILTYINNRFPELRTTEDIAKQFYISTATMNRWFREYLRISPKNYLESRRLAYSKHLLSRDLSVTEVSSMAGFTGCSRFIFVFRRSFGITPLQYQKSLHGHDVANRQ